MRNNLSRDLEKLSRDVHDMRMELTSMTRGAADYGTATGHAALRRAEAFGDGALERAEAFGDAARRKALLAEKGVRDGLEERPFISLLAAFGIGFLFAKLLDAGTHMHRRQH